MDNPFLVAALTFVGYLVGSIPFGIVASKALEYSGSTYCRKSQRGLHQCLTRRGSKGRDPYTRWRHGEGMDGGLVCVWHWLTDEVSILIVALASILGHLYSVFLAFHGGKGVATALGVVMGIAPLIGFSMLAIWLMAVWLWRYSSGGALAAFGFFPLFSLVFHTSQIFLGFACIVTALIWIRHRDNVIRLWSGTESRIGQATKS